MKINSVKFRLKLLVIVIIGILLTSHLGGVMNHTIRGVSAEQEPVSYYLPYPGILPDHPLYWLKMIRDRVQLLLTREVEARTEKLLLYADKRLGAGWALIDGGKVSLGVTTVTKGEKYLERAVIDARELGRDSRVKQKLNKAILKHIEVVNLLKEKIDNKEYDSVMQKMLDRFKTGQEQSDLEKQVELQIYFDENRLETFDVKGKNALDILIRIGEEKDLDIKIKEYSFGSLVEEINGHKNNKEKSWIYFINGESGQVAADQYDLKNGDKVEWKYIEPEI